MRGSRKRESICFSLLLTTDGMLWDATCRTIRVPTLASSSVMTTRNTKPDNLFFPNLRSVWVFNHSTRIEP